MNRSIIIFVHKKALDSDIDNYIEKVSQSVVPENLHRFKEDLFRVLKNIRDGVDIDFKIINYNVRNFVITEKQSSFLLRNLIPFEIFNSDHVKIFDRTF